MKKTPTTSAEWREEIGQLQVQLERAQDEIASEHTKRQAFAVATVTGDKDADRKFNTSFDRETELRREAEKLQAILDASQQQLTVVENREREEAERQRLEALDAVNVRQLASAQRIDAILGELAAEAARFDSISAEGRKLNSRFTRQTSVILAAAAKAVGLRQWLGMTSSQRPRPAAEIVALFYNSYTAAETEDEIEVEVA